MKKKIEIHHHTLIVLLVIALGIGLFYWFSGSSNAEVQNLVVSLPSKSREAQRQIVKTLLAKVGSLETQELLVRSSLPNDGESHFLVHDVGVWNYEHYGKKGLLYCEDYFLNACYHGVLILELADNGIEGVKDIMAECKKVDLNTYGMCAHGIGHGFFAWTKYDLPEALSLCDTFDDIKEGYAALHCHVGVFMENIYGVHNGGPIENNPWLSDTDPNFPCNAVDEKYVSGCWLNQAARIYEMVKGDLKKIAEVCDQVTDARHQEECYDSFARQVQPLTKGQYEAGKELCQYATGKKWQEYCLSILAVSTMSLGDYERTPYRLCEAITDERTKETCYYQLADYIRKSGFSLKERQSICSNIKHGGALLYCAES